MEDRISLQFQPKLTGENVRRSCHTGSAKMYDLADWDTANGSKSKTSFWGQGPHTVLVRMDIL